jgi:heme exporter protein A
LLASLLDVQNLTFSRDDQLIIQDVNLKLTEGQIIYVSGSNGSGKSTLLKLLANLLNPDFGTIQWSQAYLYAYLGHKISIKHFASPLENILYASNGYLQKCAPVSAMAILERLQLGESSEALKKRPTVSFSFGQQRKISMACIMASFRPVWILDEPFTGLDEVAKTILNECFQEKIKQGGAIMMASHIAPDKHHQNIIL